MDTRLHILGTTGGDDLFEEEAGVVFCNHMGVQWEYWYWDDDQLGEHEYHRAIVRRTEVPDDVWAWLKWADVNAVAKASRMKPEQLDNLGRSASVMDRVRTLELIRQHYSTFADDQFDDSPKKTERRVLRSRWPLG